MLYPVSFIVVAISYNYKGDRVIQSSRILFLAFFVFIVFVYFGLRSYAGP
jgi:hypothetical protein